MVHGENHFYIDSYLSIGPRGVDFPLPCFQVAHTPCHVDLCWCSTLRHQRSPVWHWRSAKAKITHCVFEIRYSVEIMLGMFTAIRERMRGLFSGYLELLVHFFSHIVYFRWRRRVIWTTDTVGGSANRNELGRNEDGRLGLQFGDWTNSIGWWVGYGRAWGESGSRNDSWVFSLSNWADGRSSACRVFK